MCGPYDDLTQYEDPTPAERERLSLLVEECAEVQQMAAKILRHGYENFLPHGSEHLQNRKVLEEKLGDLVMAMDLLSARGDIDAKKVMRMSNRKWERVWSHMHYNGPFPDEMGYQENDSES